ncbi:MULTISPECIES: aspartate ammonia-lyase [unclassified Photobacterium]|uniref:aspartate ammonia-lyase n=1 Tax=unclassified Photobacterium TaxID=2628852 RepID=UPI001B8B30F3|nr:MULTISPECIES: aspartate ammonia-lyase [unclassified Photobacterium]MDO6708610.1 aspartate ammonia-lyase [Photobacterium sp. 1_MG-2023]QUJ69786.1 aspartate ammonia-lyase [Photobacterium sp. GJ3]
MLDIAQKVRIEEDLLGTREIPANAYYGIHSLRAYENFNISSMRISDIPEFVRGMVFTKKAAARANMALGSIPSDVGQMIIQACDLILETGKCMDQFISDVYQGGAGTSVNMNTNEVIANVALELMGREKGEYHIINPNDHVNKSQSTNCAYPTGFRIAVYHSIMKLLGSIEHLQAAFDAKSVEFSDVLKMGRTQLQDAVPMTVGQEFRAFSVLLKEEIKNLHYAAALLLEVNLGATAIGTGLNAPAGYQALAVQYLAEATGLDCVPAEDLIEATSDCGAYVTVHAALKRLAVKMSKVSNDLRLLSSGPRAGLNEINLPEMQAGSSIMPAKVNPVIPEVVNQVCFKVIGNDTTVTMAAEAGQLQLNVMEPVIGQALFESIELLGNACINLADKCVSGITVNRQICEDYVFNSIGIVTYLNPYIGHHEGDIVGKICAETGRSVKEVALERGLLSEDDLNDIFSAQNLMRPVYKAKLYS